MSNDPESELIFVSYSSPDREQVARYHDELKARGYNVWMDFRQLKPGQVWDFEVRRILNKAALIIVFISKSSVDRRGYAQREIKLALDRASEKLSSDIYLVPVLLDEDATIPEELQKIHIVRASESDCVEKIEDSIRHQFEQLGANSAAAQGQSNVRWSRSSYRDRWDGLPGYETEFELLHFSSDQYPRVGEVTDVIKGQLLSSVMEFRFIKFAQDAEQYNFGQQAYARMQTWEAFASEPTIVGKVLSLRYSVHSYTFGAHGNSGFLPFCFVLDPLVPVADLKSLFVDGEKAFETIRSVVRQQLLDPTTNEEKLLPEETVFAGTEDWDCFSCFGFDQDGLDIAFAPYAVGPYAAGPQYAKVQYDMFKALLMPWFRYALDV